MREKAIWGSIWVREEGGRVYRGGAGQSNSKKTNTQARDWSRENMDGERTGERKIHGKIIE